MDDQSNDTKEPLSAATMPPFTKPSKLYRLGPAGGGNGSPQSPPSIWLEIRLFYVRISPCAVDSLPETLSLRLLRRDVGASLEVNGCRVPASDAVSTALRRDRVDRDASEATYVGTDGVRVAGGVEFEVAEDGGGGGGLLLCGSLERYEGEWRMECHAALSGGASSSSSFVQPRMGISSPSIEVYVAGRCADAPVILTKTINVSPRRKMARCAVLDAIPEVDDERRGDSVDSDRKGLEVALVGHRKLQFSETEDEYETEGKIVQRWYPDDVYEGEDGQLSWFNAGVRVGVGIGLGMCLGIGIGVGLLMRSYQATSRTFRRRFL